MYLLKSAISASCNTVKTFPDFSFPPNFEGKLPECFKAFDDDQYFWTKSGLKLWNFLC